ncbi:MAG: hypothetical protein ABI663_03070 [Chryseolinea sp.]
MKGIILFLLMSMVFTMACAQGDFIPGYVIDVKGDTIKGFIDDKDWVTNPSVINFKISAEDVDSRKLTVNDIAVFKTKNSYYKSKVVSFEKGLIHNGQPELEHATVFLEVLVEGDISLYFLTESNDKVHFFIEKAGTIEELVKRKMMTITNGSKYFTTLDLYKGQLSLALKDCNTIDSKINSLSYSPAKMRALFQYYYNCKTTTPSYIKSPKQKGKIEFGVMLGGAVNKLTFKSNSSTFDRVENAHLVAPSFPIGVNLEFTLAKLNQKWAVNVESFYTAMNFKDGDVEFDLAYIKVNAMVRRYFVTGSFKPFVNVGLSHYFALKSEGIIYSGNPEYNELNKTGLGLTGGLGVRKNKLSFEVRYEYADGVTSMSTLKSYFNSVYILATYRLISKK